MASIGVGVLAVVATAITVLIPARTEPIRGADGTVVPGSVAELTRVSVTGGELKLLIRGTSDTNPVLLFLAGGPGGSEFGAMRRHGEALEDDFVVATLDQRGVGSSYDQLEPLATHTLANAVTDVIEVTEYLRTRFGQRQVYLVGQSWGSFLGVLAAQERPDLFAAFVGVGQMVDVAETDRIFYDDTLAWARARGNVEFVAQLEAAGPPPYSNLLDYPMVFAHEQQVYGYDHSANAEGAGQMMENLPVSEYSPLDTVNIVRGLLDTFSALYPQLQDQDLRQSAARTQGAGLPRRGTVRSHEVARTPPGTGSSDSRRPTSGGWSLRPQATGRCSSSRRSSPSSCGRSPLSGSPPPDQAREAVGWTPSASPPTALTQRSPGQPQEGGQPSGNRSPAACPNRRR